jgi:hypothetical protein
MHTAVQSTVQMHTEHINIQRMIHSKINIQREREMESKEERHKNS